MLKKYIIAISLLLAPAISFAVLILTKSELIGSAAFLLMGPLGVLSWLVLPIYVSSQKNKETRKKIHIAIVIAFIIAMIAFLIFGFSDDSDLGYGEAFVAGATLIYIAPKVLLYMIVYWIYNKYFKK